MPEFTVEVHSKSVYGEFFYDSADKLRQDIISGNLKMNDPATTISEGALVRLVVKEVKPEKE